MMATWEWRHNSLCCRAISLFWSGHLYFFSNPSLELSRILCWSKLQLIMFNSFSLGRFSRSSRGVPSLPPTFHLERKYGISSRFVITYLLISLWREIRSKTDMNAYESIVFFLFVCFNSQGKVLVQINSEVMLRNFRVQDYITYISQAIGSYNTSE